MKATTITFSAIFLLLSLAVSDVTASADGGYGLTPTKPAKPELPYKIKEKEVPKPIEIQGLIYCKSGSKVFPLKGATARITCVARNHIGLQLAPFSVSSCPADDKGYFLAKLSPSPTKYLKHTKWELKECKAFLEKSPLDECKFPLDINGGVKGAHIISSSAHRLLKNANLYSLKPFFYTSDKPKLVSDNKGY
ncbi:Pollen Ole e 1 allergen/extensin [Artemisia annua]|uniref:Pollen Ole e 1 allergen/extensin n=1 Tax=Artemisia annua TaxID=35608 RepID=A0A2U1QAC0_ARTAN|nr:Pollen Ole e 1 allergen/extensin [Artemisia annua]